MSRPDQTTPVPTFPAIGFLLQRMIACVSLGILGGCYDYMPVEVTIINVQTGQNQPGVRVRPWYELGRSNWLFLDQRWRTTDANGKAVLPIVDKLAVRYQNSSGRYVTHRFPPNILVDDANFSIQGGGSEWPLDPGTLRRASGLTDESNPFPVELKVVPNPQPK